MNYLGKRVSWRSSILSAKVLQSEAAAIAWVEERVWPQGPVCPHCGGFDRIGKMAGKATRIGLYKCYQCRKQFTVKVGTVFEDSHVPMNLWLQAMYLLCSSKKGISSNQLHRTLGVTLKTAWFMSHRIREAVKRLSALPRLAAARRSSRSTRPSSDRLGGMPKQPKSTRPGTYKKYSSCRSSLADRSARYASILERSPAANCCPSSAPTSRKRLS